MFIENKKKKFKFFLIIILFFYYIKRFEILFIAINSLFSIKKEIIFSSIYNNSCNNQISFDIQNLKYFFNFKYNIIQIQYNIYFYDIYYNLIKPSDIILFHGLRVFCIMEGINNNINISSIADIVEDLKFRCIEFFNNNDKIKFGIKILNSELNNYNLNSFFFNDNIMNNYSFFNYKTNRYFEPYFIMNHSHSLKKINNKSLDLKNIYMNKPYYCSKYNLTIKENIWIFKNIFNHHFCFCSGKNCNYKKISQKCKYLFYLYIIDNNRYIFNKTNYLLADFFLKTKSSDDALPVFREMIKRNISAHYMTEKEDIYKEYCQNEKRCLKIIPIFKGKSMLDGEFFEKYFSIILKLKAVITSISFNSFHNIFMYISYITYINLGHGVKYFKHFLYQSFSSHLKYDKVLLPPSEKIISVAKKYHWTEENIIKICLPRWDKYDIYKRRTLLNKKKNNNKSTS